MINIGNIGILIKCIIKTVYNLNNNNTHYTTNYIIDKKNTYIEPEITFMFKPLIMAFFP